MGFKGREEVASKNSSTEKSVEIKKGNSLTDLEKGISKYPSRNWVVVKENKHTIWYRRKQ